MKHCRFFGNRAPAIILVLLMVLPVNTLAADTWNYHQESDSLTNRTFSFAQSPIPPRGNYDNMRLEIVCKENKLQAVIEADNLIASQNSSFDLDYQIDKKTPVMVPMKTFSDTKRRGYTTEFAKSIADDMLAGQTIFIRVTTMIRTVLSTAIPLDNAEEAIKHVFADCGLGLSDSEHVYSLAEFEKAFAQLSSEQQQQVLLKIRQIIMETR